MRGLQLLFIFLIASFSVSAGIGKLTKTFNDASRNRNIETDIYYPAANSGDNVPALQGSYPLLVWGHGFLMSVNAYQNVVNALVNEGYIVALPKTESGITPSHLEFAKDLLFLINHLTENENNLSSSILFQRFDGTAALGGHSMGGGASMLAGQLGNGNLHLKTIVNFAAANTNPSAVDAAAGISVPVLIFSGANDCIAGLAQHQQPIFNNVASACKMLVVINGGSHCYFADSSFTCSLGELTCTPSATISRLTQHQRTFAVMKPWLDIYLKSANAALVSQLLQTLSNSSYYTFTNQCNTLDVSKLSTIHTELTLIADNLYQIQTAAEATLQIMDAAGKILIDEKVYHSCIIDLSAFSTGVYLIKLESPVGMYTGKLFRL